MRVLLVGVGCVGKTTIGAILARRLGVRFLDLDAESERHYRKSYGRTDIHADIAGLDAESAAARTEILVTEHLRLRLQTDWNG